MKRQHILGGVIAGAGSALVANALLFGSLFAEGSIANTLLIAAGLALLASIAFVGLTVIVRPSDSRMIAGPTAGRLRNVA